MVWMVLCWSITLADKIKTMELAVKSANMELKQAEIVYYSI
jgi:hypothetical protein